MREMTLKAAHLWKSACHPSGEFLCWHSRFLSAEFSEALAEGTAGLRIMTFNHAKTRLEVIDQPIAFVLG